MQTTYYAAVARNYSKDKRVLQVTDCIDNLSCEILANPGIRSAMFDKVTTMIAWGKQVAKRYNCQYLEVDCSKGFGSYKWLKVN